MNRRAGGFTLIELMVTVAILGILAAIAIPSFQTMIQKNRLRNAAEEVYGILVEARSEAVLRKFDTLVNVNSATWCVGYNIDLNSAGTADVCDCTETDVTQADACRASVAGTPVLKRVDASDFPGVTMTSASTNLSFDRIRGTAQADTVSLSAGEWGIDTRVSVVGRVIVCTPVGSESVGFEACP